MDDWNKNTESGEEVQPIRRARRNLPTAEKEMSLAKIKEEYLSPAPEFQRESLWEKAAEKAVETEPKTEDEKRSGVQTPSLEENALSPKKNPLNKQNENELSPAGNLFDWIKSFLFSLAAVIFIFTLIFRGVTVSGDSMLPTLHDKEYLIISDLVYTPKTGDIVVVQSPTYKNGTEPLIKRIIATGGQTLKINFKTWQVWVDGVELQEDYVAFEEDFSMNCEDMEANEDGIAEIVVEENCVFVMGDHRNDSLDSRSHAVGQIDERYIMGRVLIRVTPFSKFGKVA